MEKMKASPCRAFRILRKATIRLTSEQYNSLYITKQVIHCYLVLYHIVVTIVRNAICRYHNKMQGAFVLRHFSIYVEFVLKIVCVILVDLEDI